MGQTLWYKRTTWSTSDRADFLAHIKRARQNAPLYLQMQSQTLQQTGNPKLIEAALELIDIYLENWSDDLGLPQVYLQKAECLASQGRIAESAIAYRKSIETNRTRPNIQTMARAKFALFVVKNNLTEFYSETLALLNESSGFIIFPIQTFDNNAAMALLLDHQGDKAGARSHAQLALNSTNVQNSGLPQHAQLGLVNKPDPWITKRLKEIVGT